MNGKLFVWGVSTWPLFCWVLVPMVSCVPYITSLVSGVACGDWVLVFVAVVGVVVVAAPEIDGLLNILD